MAHDAFHQPAILAELVSTCPQRTKGMPATKFSQTG